MKNAELTRTTDEPVRIFATNGVMGEDNRDETLWEVQLNGETIAYATSATYAKLIAASPLLLKAVKTGLVWCDDGCPSSERTATERQFLDEANEALSLIKE